MFRIISQNKEFDVPYENSVVRLSYRKVDDNSKDPKMYIIDFYVPDYEDSPIMMGAFTKEKYRDYVKFQLEKGYDTFLSKKDTDTTYKIPYYEIPLNSDVEKLEKRNKL